MEQYKILRSKSTFFKPQNCPAGKRFTLFLLTMVSLITAFCLTLSTVACAGPESNNNKAQRTVSPRNNSENQVSEDQVSENQILKSNAHESGDNSARAEEPSQAEASAQAKEPMQAGTSARAEEPMQAEASAQAEEELKRYRKAIASFESINMAEFQEKRVIARKRGDPPFYLYIGRESCSDCRKLAPLLQQIKEKHDVSLFYINPDIPDEAFAAFIEEQKLTHIPLLFEIKDGALTHLEPEYPYSFSKLEKLMSLDIEN